MSTLRSLSLWARAARTPYRTFCADPPKRKLNSIADEQRRVVRHAHVLRAAPTAGSSSTVSEAAAAAAASDRPLLVDTHALVVALERAGFTREQAAAVADALVAVSSAAQRRSRDEAVSKSAFADLRAELSILEKADFMNVKTETALLEKRLDTAVAELYTSVERVENRVIKWVVAVAGALALGLLRVTGVPILPPTITPKEETKPAEPGYS